MLTFFFCMGIQASPSRLRPRIALTRPGDARAKGGGAIPLVEPELSPESQPPPKNYPSIISIRRASIIVPALNDLFNLRTKIKARIRNLIATMVVKVEHDGPVRR